jgi:hypothetical protein
MSKFNKFVWSVITLCIVSIVYIQTHPKSDFATKGPVEWAHIIAAKIQRHVTPVGTEVTEIVPIQALATPGGGIYYTEDTTIVHVSPTGLITPVGRGDATVCYKKEIQGTLQKTCVPVTIH